MRSHRMLAEFQLCCDLAVAHAERETPGYLSLPSAKTQNLGQLAPPLVGKQGV